jgi:CheY-like chemotaxis protein
MKQEIDPLTDKTILVVEDDVVSGKLLKEILHGLGYKTNMVKLGLEAIIYIKTKPNPNLVFMDIKLPDIDGIALTQDLLKLNPNLIVVAQTAYTYQGIEDQCYAAGMKGFLSKPIKSKDIKRIIDTLL